MNIYVSNISYTATDEALQSAFAAYGTVQSARIIRDRSSGRSRGFGFVEMEHEEEGRKAVEALAGFDLMGRALSVREARPKEEGASNGTPADGASADGAAPEGRGRGNGQNGGGRGRNGNQQGRQRAEKPQAPEPVIIQRGMY